MQRAWCLALVVAAAVAVDDARDKQPHCARDAGCQLLRCYPHQHPNKCDFEVQGKHFSIIYSYGISIELYCNVAGTDLLPLAALPRFATKLEVEFVTVKKCQSTVYADVLRMLNVSYESLYLNLKSSEGLVGAHLAGLSADLTQLTVYAAAGTGPLRLPANLLELPKLRKLAVTSATVVTIDRKAGDDSNLEDLYIKDADGALLANWSLPHLRVVRLVGWRNMTPPAVPTCAALVNLTLEAPRVCSLPARWVARCSNLAALTVQDARCLTKLPRGLLANASSLRTLVIKSTGLTSLPEDLFVDTLGLEYLDLSNNHLKELPSGLLVHASGLQHLDLAFNPLGDLCQTANYPTEVQNDSSLMSLTKLEVLNLKKTNVTVICKDWHWLPSLTELDLSGTNIHILGCKDLQFEWRTGSVNLQDIPLLRLIITSEDYEAAGAGGNVTVQFNGSGSNLTCNCDLHRWAFGVKWRQRVHGAGELRCVEGGVLGNLACSAPGDLSAASPTTPSTLLPAEPSATPPNTPLTLLPTEPSATPPNMPLTLLPTEPSAALTVTLTVVVVVVILGAGVLAARCGALRWLKEVVGRVLRARPPEVPTFPYDVFVTFGAGDEKDALETTARLEAGGWRVLLQERDWLPPAWLSDCLVLSVRAAHATVALASPAWERSLRSAEVRDAFEDALVVLVLPPGGELQDAGLRRYARDHPHRVWRRGSRRGLKRALPPPQHSPGTCTQLTP